MSVSIYIDAYFIPLKPHAEVVTKMWRQRHGLTQVTVSYHAATAEHSYRIPAAFYGSVNVNDTIMVLRSIVTNVVQEMATLNEGQIGNYCNTSILRADSSFNFLIVAPIGIIVLFIFYDRVPFREAKKNLTYFSLAVSLLFLIVYLTLNSY